MKTRTTEFILGLLGGIAGFIGALIALFIGGLGGVLGTDGALTIVYLGWAAIAFSILGIVGSVVVRTRAKLGGTFMIISAIGGVISVSFAYALAFILLLIAGIMGVWRK